MSKNNFYIFLLCICFIFLTANTPGVDAASKDNNYNLTKQIQYSFTLQNKTNHLLNRAEFWTYAPVKETSTQRCIKIEASHPYELIVDDSGNQILYFKFINMPPYATRIINIKAELQVSDRPNPVHVQNISYFLQSEKYIESDHPEITNIAAKLKSAKAARTAENIFRWVAHSIHYTGYLSDDFGALYALRNKKGDCTEYMYLFTALCRANKIPARGIGGYICRENTILKPNEYHNWAEFYEDGTWKLADPQKKIFMQHQPHYIAMSILSESTKNPLGKFHRFRFTGQGLEVKMNRT